MDAEKKIRNFESCLRGSRQLSGLFIGKGKVLGYRKAREVWVEQKGSRQPAAPSQDLQRNEQHCKDLKVQSRWVKLGMVAPAAKPRPGSSKLNYRLRPSFKKIKIIMNKYAN